MEFGHIDNPMTAHVLRVLFFPEPEDFENGPVGHVFISKTLASEPEKWPHLGSPVEVGGHRYECRRPMFLECLSDSEYADTYQRLVDNREVELVTWDYIVNMARQTGDVVRSLLMHVMVWVNPKWRFPAQASKEYKTFSWKIAVAKDLLQNSTLVDGGSRPWDGQDSLPDLNDLAEKFLTDLWTMVEGNDYWSKYQKNTINDHHVPSILSTDPPKLTKNANSPASPNTGGTLRRPIWGSPTMSRFSEGHWKEVVYLVFERAGPCLVGHMKQFNDVSDSDGMSSVFNREQNIEHSTSSIMQSSAAIEFIHEQRKIYEGILTYRLHKSSMLRTLRTLEKECTGASGLQSKEIESEDEYKAAQETVKHSAEILRQHGWNPMLDYSDEDLLRFALVLPGSVGHPGSEFCLPTKGIPECSTSIQTEAY